MRLRFASSPHIFPEIIFISSTNLKSPRRRGGGFHGQIGAKFVITSCIFVRFVLLILLHHPRKLSPGSIRGFTSFNSGGYDPMGGTMLFPRFR